MTTPQQLIDSAREQGYRALFAGLLFEQNPHRSGDDDPGSQSFRLSAAWKQGYQEAEVAEAEGSHFREA